MGNKTCPSLNQDCIVVLVTASNREEAEKIVYALIEQGLIACANILPEVDSVFKWEGKVCREKEVMLVMKTTSGQFEVMSAKIRELHSYKVPEVIALPVLKGSKDYLDWVRQLTLGKEE